MAVSLGDQLVVGGSGALNLLMPMGRLYTITLDSISDTSIIITRVMDITTLLAMGITLRCMDISLQDTDDIHQCMDIIPL